MKTDKKNTKYNPNITKEDKDILGDQQGNLRTDGGEDEQLKHRKKPVDFEGEDLDIPGRTLPEDRKEELKDEENQLYSGDNDNNQS